MGKVSKGIDVYIKSTETEYGLEHKDVDSMTKEELLDYLDFLDDLHDK